VTRVHGDGASRRARVYEAFWAKSTSGTGTLALVGKPPRANSAVVVNAGGSRGVTPELFGVRG
jgi:hypothetical protein